MFSRRRDYAKREPLSPADFDRLSATPEQGGLLMGYRIAPYYFGFEPLPALPRLIAPTHAPAPSNPKARRVSAPRLRPASGDGDLHARKNGFSVRHSVGLILEGGKFSQPKSAHTRTLTSLGDA